MPTPELQPTAAKIDKVLARIADGDIKVPAFQRGFVWDQDQVVKLVDSLYHNYPIGSILLWNSMERLKSTRNIAGFQIPDRQPSYPVNYVLDGQQRLSTVYAVFCKDRTPVETDGQYAVDHSIFDVSFDLVAKQFVPSSDVPTSHSHFRLQLLFNPDAFFLQWNSFRVKIGRRCKNCIRDSTITKFHLLQYPAARKLKLASYLKELTIPEAL